MALMNKAIYTLWNAESSNWSLKTQTQSIIAEVDYISVKGIVHAHGL